MRGRGSGVGFDGRWKCKALAGGGAQALGCASRAKSALGPVLVHSFPATARLEPAPLPLVPKRTAHAMACFSEH